MPQTSLNDQVNEYPYQRGGSSSSVAIKHCSRSKKRQMFRVVASLFSLISLALTIVDNTQLIGYSRIILITTTLIIPLTLYFVYWMRLISHVEGQKTQLERRRAQSPMLHCLKTYAKWSIGSLLMSIISKFHLSSYVVFRGIYQRFNVMLTQELAQLILKQKTKQANPAFISQQQQQQQILLQSRQNVTVNDLFCGNNQQSMHQNSGRGIPNTEIQLTTTTPNKNYYLIPHNQYQMKNKLPFSEYSELDLSCNAGRVRTNERRKSTHFKHLKSMQQQQFMQQSTSSLSTGVRMNQKTEVDNSPILIQSTNIMHIKPQEHPNHLQVITQPKIDLDDKLRDGIDGNDKKSELCPETREGCEIKQFYQQSPINKIGESSKQQQIDSFDQRNKAALKSQTGVPYPQISSRSATISCVDDRTMFTLNEQKDISPMRIDNHAYGLDADGNLHSKIMNRNLRPKFSTISIRSRQRNESQISGDIHQLEHHQRFASVSSAYLNTTSAAITANHILGDSGEHRCQIQSHSSILNSCESEQLTQLLANQQFDEFSYLREKHYLSIIRFSVVIELALTQIPLLLVQILNLSADSIVVDDQQWMLSCATILSACIILLAVIVFSAFDFHDVKEENQMQEFFKVINVIQEKQEQNYNLAKAKAALKEGNVPPGRAEASVIVATTAVAKGVEPIDMNINKFVCPNSVENTICFPFPAKIILNSMDELSLLAKCSLKSLQNVQELSLNLAATHDNLSQLVPYVSSVLSDMDHLTKIMLHIGWNRLNDEVLKELLNRILGKTRTQPLEFFEMHYEENQTTSKGEVELRQILTVWEQQMQECIADHFLAGDQFISVRVSSSTSQEFLQRQLLEILNAQTNKGCIKIMQFYLKQTLVSGELLRIILGFVKQAINLTRFELHLNNYCEEEYDLLLTEIELVVRNNPQMINCFIVVGNYLRIGILSKKRILNDESDSIRLEINDFEYSGFRLAGDVLNVLSIDSMHQIRREKVHVTAKQFSHSIGLKQKRLICSNIAAFDQITHLDIDLLNCELEDDDLVFMFSEMKRAQMLKNLTLNLKGNKLKLKIDAREALVKSLLFCEQLQLNFEDNDLSSGDVADFIRECRLFSKATHILLNFKNNAELKDYVMLNSVFNQSCEDCKCLVKKVFLFDTLNSNIAHRDSLRIRIDNSSD